MNSQLLVRRFGDLPVRPALALLLACGGPESGASKELGNSRLSQVNPADMNMSEGNSISDDEQTRNLLDSYRRDMRRGEQSGFLCTTACSTPASMTAGCEATSTCRSVVDEQRAAELEILRLHSSMLILEYLEELRRAAFINTFAAEGPTAPVDWVGSSAEGDLVVEDQATP